MGWTRVFIEGKRIKERLPSLLMPWRLKFRTAFSLSQTKSWPSSTEKTSIYGHCIYKAGLCVFV